MAVDKVLTPPSQKEVIDKINEIIDNLGNLSYSSTCPALTSSGGLVTWNVTHNLNSNSVLVGLYDSNGKDIMRNVTVNSANAISVTWPSDTNIAAESYNIIVLAEGSTGGSPSPTPTPVVDENFIAANTRFTLKADGSGDFTVLQDVFSYLTGKWSNGIIYIDVGEGVFSSGSVNVSGIAMNIPYIQVTGQGVDTSIFKLAADGGNYRIYLSNQSISFQGVRFECTGGYSPLVLCNFTNLRRRGIVYFQNCKFKHCSKGIEVGEGNQVIFDGTNTFEDFSENAILSSYGGLATVSYNATLNFTNSSNKGTAMRTTYQGRIICHGSKHNFTNVNTSYNPNFNTYSLDGCICGTLN